MITVESFCFNHDLTSMTNDAMTLRMNATQQVPLPEWTRGRTDGFPSAYVISTTQGRVITIQVELPSVTLDHHLSRPRTLSLEIMANRQGGSPRFVVP